MHQPHPMEQPRQDQQSHGSPVELQMDDNTSEWQPQRQVQPYNQPSRSQMEHRLGPRVWHPMQQNHQPYRRQVEYRFGADESMRCEDEERRCRVFRSSPNEQLPTRNPDRLNRQQLDYHAGHASRRQTHGRFQPNVFDRLGDR